MDATTSRADALRAEERKTFGNEMFSRGKLGAAIEAYSEAITFDPNQSVYYTNRAMCFRKKADWDAVIADCETALLLEDTSIKGHYLLGVALDAVGSDYAAAVVHLRRALELCKDRTVSYKEDIQRAMLGARKRQWEAEQARAIPAFDEADGWLQRTLGQQQQQQQQSEDEAARVGAVVRHAIDASRAKCVPGRVPDYFTCRVTLEIMLDPVVAPSGITYERSAIMQHLKQNGNFDPVTRLATEPSQLVPNIALKEAINQYLEECPWAYQCDD